MTKIKEALSLDKHVNVNTYLYDCSCQPKSLIQGLNSLRDKEELLDITLVADGQKFRAHKVVLAACSDYFRAMFTGNMLESRQNEIALNGVSADGFRILLDYAYTCRLPLDLTNVQDVLSAASHCQMQEIVRICSNYLETQIDIENCVDLATIAEDYCLNQLNEKVYKFMSSHLTELSKSSEFYRLTVQQLYDLLMYEFPVDCSEAEVLKIVLTWICHVDKSDANMRQIYAIKLLQGINFLEINLSQLEDVLSKTVASIFRCDPNLYQMVFNESRRQGGTSETTEVAAPPPDLLNSRGMEMALLKIGGFGGCGVTNEITYRLSSSQTWRHLTSVPHVEQCNFGSAVFENELYVIGGCFNQALQENVHPFGFRYSPVLNKWHTITPMKTERCRFSLNVVNRKLYAIGGSTEVDDDYQMTDLPSTNTCEVYDPTCDTWESILPLPEVRTQHAAAAYENDSRKYLFVSGGIYRDAPVMSLLAYDTEKDVWRWCPAMPTPRADHVLLTVGDFLYACGGWMEDRRSRTRTHNSSIDRYNILDGTWETITTVPTPRYHAGIVSMNKKIYLIGGYRSESMFAKETANIECYDIDSNTWTTLEKYPQDIWEHSCATLYIPKCRDDLEVLARSESGS